MDQSSTLRHSALNGSLEGTPLAQARLNDQQRLAVVLQGAALLAHLEHAGWFLPRGWQDASIAGDTTLLQINSVLPGKSLDLPQVLLLDLLKTLFSPRRNRGSISGKGTARNAARWLQERWQQYLMPISLDQAVAETLNRAPFLWQPAYAGPRTALAAEQDSETAADLWIAGPGPSRTRLLARATSYKDLAILLATPEAQDLWEGWQPHSDPRELAAKGRFHQAAISWRRTPPKRLAEALEYARCLINLGRFSQADELLRRRGQFKACLLRLHCLMELGRHKTCQQLISRMIGNELEPGEMMDLAKIAVHTHARQGQRRQSLQWVQRAFHAAAGNTLLGYRAELLAAEAAWDQNEISQMEHHLARAQKARDNSEVSKRWHEVHNLYALGRRDGGGVIEHNTAVLRHRSSMSKTEAGRRWNDLAYGRLLLGDLAGAEKAIRHAGRLMSGTESISRNTLGFSNLAGIRLRRGHIHGAEEAIKVSMAENRRQENDRGLVGDLELAVRLLLAQGRPEDALVRCHEAFELISESGVGDRQIFDLFAARAHGWLDSPEKATACLQRITPEILFEIEPEERPAIWALAGQMDRAAREAANTPWSDLWSSLAMGFRPRPDSWEELERLEPFRAARLTFDYLILAHESVPPMWINRAMESLRATGAFSFAMRIERRFFSPWLAVKHYLESPNTSRISLTDLFDSAGYPQARLSLIENNQKSIVKPGQGGPAKCEVAHESGRLVVEAPFIDSTLETLIHLVRRDIKAFETEDLAESGRLSTAGIIGESPSLIEAYARIDQLAKGELPFLILGASGTGKELAARRVHNLSQRSQSPFRDVNCAALPNENLIQSELFGHRKGSFTGADQDRQGIFEQAKSGTVFLDEIGDLPLAVQGTLLRVLQEGELRRLGDEHVRKVDVRVVAATHRDLPRMIQDGLFRQDLYFRLKGAAVELPALRDRGNDIILIANYFLQQDWKSQGSTSSTPLRISPEAQTRLLRHSWPGNVRELKQVMKHAVTFARGRLIRVKDLGLEEEKKTERQGYHRQLNDFKRQLVDGALAQSQGNKSEAARRLSLTRQALAYIIRQLELEDST